MNRLLITFSSFTVAVVADVSRLDISEDRYESLWKNSPFTSISSTSTPEDAFKYYTLGGISKLDDGYFAILFNRKDRRERVVIFPGEKDDLKVIDVEWPANSWRDAAVTLQNESGVGVIRFDDEILLRTPITQSKAGSSSLFTNKKTPNTGNSSIRTPYPPTGKLKK